MIKFSQPHLLADYAEWRILHGGQQEISKGDLQTEAAVQGGLDPNDPSVVSGPNTRLDAQIDDCFVHLQYRAGVFGASYPLSVAADVLTMSPAVSATAGAGLLYKFLLACAVGGTGADLAATFSEVCKLAVSRLMGARARVYNIDVGSDDRQALGTDKRVMARNLAGILGARAKDLNIDELSAAGDNGADIVGSMPFEDGAVGYLAILGQCAASGDETYWKDKIFQPKRFASLYDWQHEPVLAGFVPVVYRSSNGSWIDHSNVHGSVVFDRLRIIKALDLTNQPLPAPLATRITAALAAPRRPSKAKRARRVKRAKRASAKKKAA